MGKTDKDFLNILSQTLSDGTFLKLTLSGYRGAEPDLKKIIVREILIKNVPHLSFTYRYKTRDIVKNHLVEDALQKISSAFKEGFGNAVCNSRDFDFSYPDLKKSLPSQVFEKNLDHDKKKIRYVETAGKIYLRELKITDGGGNVIKSAQDKFRQIDKYIEILSGLLRDVPAPVRKIVDMGSGKGYLTFALYDYLKGKQSTLPDVVGVEYRKDMVDFCNKVATASGFKTLSFIQGTIAEYDAGNLDVLIALHACDTATDDAIRKGVDGNASIIVVAPCCHKEVRRQMDGTSPAPYVADIVRHGILMERMAEMVTDSLRALYLEYAGYETKVFEFISGEHTAKNVMIVGVRRKQNMRASKNVLERIKSLKSYYGIANHALDVLLPRD